MIIEGKLYKHWHVYKDDLGQYMYVYDKDHVFYTEEVDGKCKAVGYYTDALVTLQDTDILPSVYSDVRFSYVEACKRITYKKLPEHVQKHVKQYLESLEE